MPPPLRREGSITRLPCRHPGMNAHFLERFPNAYIPPSVVAPDCCASPLARLGGSGALGRGGPALIRGGGRATQSLLEFQSLWNQLRSTAVGTGPTERQACLALLQHPFPNDHAGNGNCGRIRRPGSRSARGRFSTRQQAVAAVVDGPQAVEKLLGTTVPKERQAGRGGSS